ncbi:MAG: hypothetical protein AAFQ53_18265, partial [Bacteroidota bacterium]
MTDTAPIATGPELLAYLRAHPHERVLARRRMGESYAALSGNATHGATQPDLPYRLVDALATAGLPVEEHRAAGVVTYRLAEPAHAASGDGQASGVPMVGAPQAVATQAPSTQARTMVFDESRDRPMFVRAAQALDFAVLDAQIVEVTPALAAEWLAYNTRN